MSGKRITQQQKDRYWELRRQDFSISHASREAKFSIDSAKQMERIKKEITGARHNPGHVAGAPDFPVQMSNVSDAAKDALADTTGALFAQRYFGFELSPWQQKMWQGLEDAWASPDREYLCVNVAPGAGKSSVLVMFGCKLTTVQRNIRGLFMCRGYRLAERNTMRLRRALERTKPFENADSTLAMDFGRFRARQGEIWRASEFIVEQFDGMPVEEKEPTWAAFGFDAEWLGNRLDVIFGDDLDDTSSIRNMDIVEHRRQVFDNELEPRLEPGGLMCIAQQRLGPFDFSAHVLSKELLPEDDGITDDPEGEPQYTHVIYKAHYEESCLGVDGHVAGSPPWPEGCLLDPRRLSWRDLRKKMRDPRNFEIVYQQEDNLDNDALVQKLWIEGGRDTHGDYFIGCQDKDRGLWELPRRHDGTIALDGKVFGVITIDPSVSKFWGCIAWVIHPASQQRFLVDLHRAQMEAPDLLEWSTSLRKFTGLAEDWMHNFTKLGVPLTHMIVEQNAAHRYLLQYEHTHRWMRERHVNVQAHSTGRNKADPDFGVQLLGPAYRHGQVRLPMEGLARFTSDKLINEVTRYPHAATTDCLMSQWFLEHAIARGILYAEEAVDAGIQWRPSWLGLGETA